jgi:hypothetical protein
MKKYKIELNENQLRVIEQALETFSRMGSKQYDIACDAIQTHDEFGCLSYDQKQKIRKFIREIEGSDLAENESYGIGQKIIDDKYRVAYDMIQVFRYVRSWANAEDEPEDRGNNFSKYMGRNYDKPLKYSEEPLAECEEIEEIPDYYCQKCGMPPHQCLCSHDS